MAVTTVKSWTFIIPDKFRALSWFSEGGFNLTAEMVQKAVEAKLLRKAQRQAAMDAAKMAKRERG